MLKCVPASFSLWITSIIIPRPQTVISPVIRMFGDWIPPLPFCPQGWTGPDENSKSDQLQSALLRFLLLGPFLPISPAWCVYSTWPGLSRLSTDSEPCTQLSSSWIKAGTRRWWHRLWDICVSGHVGPSSRTGGSEVRQRRLGSCRSWADWLRSCLQMSTCLLHSIGFTWRKWILY